MVVDRASETLRHGQSCILRIHSTGTHSQALAPLDVGSVCICSIGTPRESRLSHYKETLSRNDDGDGETNPDQGMVPNDDQKYIGVALCPMCAVRCEAQQPFCVRGPERPPCSSTRLGLLREEVVVAPLSMAPKFRGRVC